MGVSLCCDLLLLLLKLGIVLVQPVQGDGRQIPSTDPSEYHGDHLRRNAPLQRFSQHVVFEPTLLQSQLFLPCLLLFLLPFVSLNLLHGHRIHQWLRTLPSRCLLLGMAHRLT